MKSDRSGESKGSDDVQSDMEGRIIVMESMVKRIKTDLYNGDNDPESGLVPEIRAWLVEERAARQRSWKRSDKLAALGILVLLLAWPAAQCWNFIHTVYQITQEWHEVHKGEIPSKSFFAEPAPVLQSSQQQLPPQDAGLPATYSSR